MTEDKKNSTFIIPIIILATLIVANAIFISTGKTREYEKMTVETLRDLSQLATVEYRIKKIVRFKDDSLLGSRRLLIEVPAVIKAGIELSGLDSSSIKMNDSGSITIRLPKPELLDLNIDLENVKEVINDTSLLRGSFSPEDKNKYLRKGEEELKKYIAEGKINILIESEQNARSIIASWLTKMGYTDINILFVNKTTESAKSGDIK